MNFEEVVAFSSDSKKGAWRRHRQRGAVGDSDGRSVRLKIAVEVWGTQQQDGDERAETAPVSGTGGDRSGATNAG